MPRKAKAKEPLEITIEAVEAVENDSPELNEDPAAISEEVEEEIAPAKPKARRKRAPRKRTEPKVAAVAEAVATPAIEAAPELIAAPVAEVAPPPVAPLPIPSPFPLPPLPVEPIAEVKENADSIVNQWQSINAISTGVCNNLERVNTMVRELPANYADAISELLKPPTPKPSPLTKLAAGVSIAAAILSVLSLSLSQSARQAILNRGEVAPVAANAPIQATRPAPQPVYQAPPVAPAAPVAQYHAPAPLINIPRPRVSAPIAMAPTPARRHVTAPVRRATSRPPVRRHAPTKQVVRPKH